jgi:hypothetical protein
VRSLRSMIYFGFVRGVIDEEFPMCVCHEQPTDSLSCHCLFNAATWDDEVFSLLSYIASNEKSIDSNAKDRRSAGDAGCRETVTVIAPRICAITGRWAPGRPTLCPGIRRIQPLFHNSTTWLNWNFSALASEYPPYAYQYTYSMN